MRHIISALVQNEPGVLAHVAGMFAARGFNIDSLVVGETENPDLSRMTIVVRGDDRVLEQVRKQLAKVVAVIKVRDFSGVAHVERENLAAVHQALVMLSHPEQVDRPIVLIPVPADTFEDCRAVVEGVSHHADLCLLQRDNLSLEVRVRMRHSQSPGTR